MTRVVLLLLTLAVLGGAGFLIYNSTENSHQSLETSKLPNFEKWHEYSSPQFHVLFPALPHYARERAPVQNSKEVSDYQMFVSLGDDGSVYSINIISFMHRDVNVEGEFLQNYMEGILKQNPDNEIKDIRKSIFKSLKALDFNVDSKEITVYGKAFLDGKDLYILTITTKPEFFNRREFEFFLNSFELNSGPSGDKK